MATRVSEYPERLVATPWLALLGILALSQTAHLFEHVAQMIQIHVLHLSGPAARGIVGQLVIEWVHFIWNGWVLVAVLVLLPRFRTNAWLIGVTLFAGWHFLEHCVMIATYLRTGLPIARPDLHFLYNLVETIPLLAAWTVELRRELAPAAR